MSDSNLVGLSGSVKWMEIRRLPVQPPFPLQNLTKFYSENLLFKRKSLRKQAYSNILKILPPKNEKFQIKNSDIFNISAQNIDCGYSLELPRWGSSKEYPQSMFLSRNKKNNVYPCKPVLLYKSGVEGCQNYIGMFSWWYCILKLGIWSMAGTLATDQQ